MKGLIAILFILVTHTAHAETVVGVGRQGAQTNCNIAMGGYGVIGYCVRNPNGTVTCECSKASPPEGVRCNTAVGVGYSGVQTNCMLQSNGRGRISNCSFNHNGTVVCSCCN